MAAVAQSVAESPRSLARFREFLRNELAPYSGRFEMVARMVTAATLVMIVSVTLRIPYAFQGAIFAPIVSRDNTQATLRSAGSIVFVSGIGAACVLVSAWFFAAAPGLHFLWTIGAFFVVFYALSVISDYNAVITFAVMIAIAVPLWDRHVSAETNVEDTLRVLFASLVGCVITALVDPVFAEIRTRNDLVVSIAERLASVEELLVGYLADRPVDQATEKNVTRVPNMLPLFNSNLSAPCRSRHITDRIGSSARVVVDAMAIRRRADKPVVVGPFVA